MHGLVLIMITNEYGYTQILQLYKGILGDDIVPVGPFNSIDCKAHHSMTVQFKVRQHPSGVVSLNSRFLTIYNMILVIYIST